MKTLLYAASDSGFDLRQVPLGGAAPICAFLTNSWRNQSDFRFRLLSPDVIGAEAPRDEDLLHYTPRQYVNFIFKFEQAVTDEILRHDRRDTVILAIDMSDGPHFRLLAEKGYAVYCIFHMNMVHVVTKAFLLDLIRPETSAAIYRFIDRSPFRFVLPKFLKLIFAKQEESLIYCRGVIVPSEGMKRVLVRMYPDVPADKIHVFPWGSHAEACDETLLRKRVSELRRQYAIPEDMTVLLTLSRISPEKGQDRLLKALEMWEQDESFPEKGVCVLMCGVAGYQHAKSYENKVKERAKTLKKVRVIFPGYVYGLEKQAHFRLANLYIFPSRYESYGLALMEALRAGLPVIASHTDGTEHLVRKEFGELLPDEAEDNIPALLKDAIRRMLGDREKLRTMGRQAHIYAKAHPFSKTADRLARLMMGPA
jgi:glycosyltransferase involved in cell wall biosynthesis